MTTPIPEIQGRANVPPSSPINPKLKPFERDFGSPFVSYVEFSKAFLQEIGQEPSNDEAAFSAQVATQRDPELLRHFDIFSDIANTTGSSKEHRSRYFESLRKVYAELDQTPARFLEDATVAFVAPEREGRILAEKMGWLPRDHSFHPNAKRTPHEGGLLVGLTEFEVSPEFKRVEIIDGAMASGATIMAIMAHLGPSTKVDIYSVHATLESIHAVTRFARLRGLDLSVFAGHVTTGLNEKYYAIDSASSRLVVGDLGDTISDLSEARG